MNKNKELIEYVLNIQNSLPSRIKAINDIGQSNEKTDILIDEFKSILLRKKTNLESTLDWDPHAEERVVDLYVIKNLNKLGYISENNKIKEYVSKAIPYMREYGDERLEIAKILKSINDKKLYQEIIDLTRSKDSIVAENAEKVLYYYDSLDSQ